MDVYALSDIHVDYHENKEWLFNRLKDNYTEDILIIAGDISSSLKTLEEIFICLNQCFKEVFYIYGNHDLWIIDSTYKNSFEKLIIINQIAKDTGIHIEAMDFKGTSIVPVFSWYDYSFGYPNDELKNIWSDYYFCQFTPLHSIEEVGHYFKLLNDNIIFNRMNQIISFSHFLPNLNLLAPFLQKTMNMLRPVMGSSYIDEYIKKYNSFIHVYGHSHFNKKVHANNRIYLNNALGYPHECFIAQRRLQCIYKDIYYEDE